jgi:hypothetical protein
MKRKYKPLVGFVILRPEPKPVTLNDKIKAWLNRIKEEVNRD